MIPDSITRDQLERIPDPRPGPDMEVADLLDGQRAATFGLARYARVLAHLPPAIADALAAEYRRACALSPDEAERYRPSAKSMAEACGLDRRAFNRIIARAILDARREEAERVAFGRPLTPSERGEGAPTPPPGVGSVAGLPLSPRSRRGRWWKR